MNTTTHNTMMKPTSLRHKSRGGVSPKQPPLSTPSTDTGECAVAELVARPHCFHRHAADGEQGGKEPLHHPHQIVVDLQQQQRANKYEWGSTISAAGDDCVTAHSLRSALRNTSAENNNDKQADQLFGRQVYCCLSCCCCYCRPPSPTVSNTIASPITHRLICWKRG